MTNNRQERFIANWHSHTLRCKHAVGDAPEYARVAAAAGLRTLGISDHMPTPDNRWVAVRMTADEVPDYRMAVEQARFEQPGLRIYIGMECEYLPEWHDYYIDELVDHQEMEYLILGAHSYPVGRDWISTFSRAHANDPHMLRAYGKYVVDSIGTGLFAFVAHPDVFGFFYDVWDEEAAAVARDIAQAAKAAHVPLEINSYGLRKELMDTPAGERTAYPWEPFWEVAAAEGATAIINSDAHSPGELVATIDEAFALADRTGVRVIVPTDLESMRT